MAKAATIICVLFTLALLAVLLPSRVKSTIVNPNLEGFWNGTIHIIDSDEYVNYTIFFSGNMFVSNRPLAHQFGGYNITSANPSSMGSSESPLEIEFFIRDRITSINNETIYYTTHHLGLFYIETTNVTKGNLTQNNLHMGWNHDGTRPASIATADHIFNLFSGIDSGDSALGGAYLGNVYQVGVNNFYQRMLQFFKNGYFASSTVSLLPNGATIYADNTIMYEFDRSVDPFIFEIRKTSNGIPDSFVLESIYDIEIVSEGVSGFIFGSNKTNLKEAPPSFETATLLAKTYNSMIPATNSFQGQFTSDDLNTVVTIQENYWSSTFDGGLFFGAFTINNTVIPRTMDLAGATVSIAANGTVLDVVYNYYMFIYQIDGDVITTARYNNFTMRPTSFSDPEAITFVYNKTSSAGSSSMVASQASNEMSSDNEDSQASFASLIRFDPVILVLTFLAIITLLFF